MKISNIVLCFLAVTLLCSCGGSKTVLSEEQKAVVAKLAEENGDDFEFTFSSFEKIDSTTLGQELDRRIEAFNQVLLQNYKLYNSYVENKKPKNAAKKQVSIELDTKMLEMLSKTKKESADKLDEIAYYVYKFSGEGSSTDKEYKYDEVYAAISPAPQYHVVAVSSTLRNLQAATGGVIKGYKEILRNSADDEEDVEE